MSNIIEKEIFIFLRRFIYSSIFVYLRKNIDKYNQWKHLSFSFAVLVAVNCVISILCFIIFPVGIMSSLVISFVLFIIYWYKRINKLKKIGNTKNSKYWNDKQFWYGLTGWQCRRFWKEWLQNRSYSRKWWWRRRYNYGKRWIKIYRSMQKI